MADSIFDQVASGKYDVQLEALSEAIRARRKYLSQQRGLANQVEFTPGTPVRIAGRISPKYLIGVTGTVSTLPARRRGDILVDVAEEDRWKMGRFGTSISVPAQCLERVK